MEIDMQYMLSIGDNLRKITAHDWSYCAIFLPESCMGEFSCSRKSPENQDPCSSVL